VVAFLAGHHLCKVLSSRLLIRPYPYFVYKGDRSATNDTVPVRRTRRSLFWPLSSALGMTALVRLRPARVGGGQQLRSPNGSLEVGKGVSFIGSRMAACSDRATSSWLNLCRLKRWTGIYTFESYVHETPESRSLAESCPPQPPRAFSL
jgi:hypothetical protein